MAGAMQSLATINSFARTLIAALVVGAAGFASYLGYEAYNADDPEVARMSGELEQAQADLERQERLLRERSAKLREQEEQLFEQEQTIVTLEEDIKEKDEQITKLETSIKLLKVDHRVARLSVLDQEEDPESGRTITTVRFEELNQEGRPIGEARTFQIEGDLVYLDSWTVKFDDKYVETSDIDRATSLLLFRRIFGEYQDPSTGQSLDPVGGQPTAYARGGRPSEFEQQIWDDFWNVANNPAKQEELGIRAAHGEAASIKVQEGMRYRIELRSSGGVSIVPEGRIETEEDQPLG